MHTIYTLDLVDVVGDADLKRVADKLRESDQLVAFIGQVERCPRTGRIHLQVYEQWKHPVSGSKLADALGVRDPIHWDLVRDPKQAQLYCQKEEARVPGSRVRGFELGYRELE